MGNKMFCNNGCTSHESVDCGDKNDTTLRISASEKGLATKMYTNKDNQNEDKLNLILGNKRVDLDSFSVLKVLGKGSFGKVSLVEHKETKKLFAMKQIKKQIIKTDRQKRHTLTERIILEKIRHPNILSLHYAFQNDNRLYLVVDFMHGGELFHHLQLHGRLKENLKPENCLLDINGNLKIADFGLSFQYDSKENQTARSMCGTPEYIAPEVILSKTGHDKTVDWWSFGVLIYEMLTGLPPFYNDDKKKMFQNIIQKPIPYPLYLSKTAVSLLKSLLQVNPINRLGYGVEDAQSIKKHQFFKGINWEKLYNQELEPPLKIQKSEAQKFKFFDSKLINQEPQMTPEQSFKQANLAFSNFTYYRKLSQQKSEDNTQQQPKIEPIQEDKDDVCNESSYQQISQQTNDKQDYVMTAYSDYQRKRSDEEQEEMKSCQQSQSISFEMNTKSDDGIFHIE